jgi:UTRA domain
MFDRDCHAFPFTASAERFDQPLFTEVLEKAIRLPSDDEHPFSHFEKKAQEELGLARNSPFMIICRVRLMGGEVKVFHRAYLNPKFFPENFLELHDFATVSLIDIYESYNLKPLSRDTTIKARCANLYEIAEIKQAYLIRIQWLKDHHHSDIEIRDAEKKLKAAEFPQIVLDAEQKLYVQGQNGKFVLEYLQASYLEDWEYTIKNRPIG